MIRGLQAPISKIFHGADLGAERAEEMKQGEAEVAVGTGSDWRVPDASQIDVEIRQALAAGDEARAFRLVNA